MNAAPTNVRTVIPAMRGVFILGSILVTAAGVQLFVLTDKTDHYFAWTIKAPITAAFLGAFYFTALAVAFQSARKSAWSEARVGVLGVFVFLVLTLVMTVVHHDKFHFNSADHLARNAAWVWFVTYLADPVFVAVAWFFQVRAPGVDAPRREPLPSILRFVLLTQGVAFVVAGLWLFFAPSSAIDAWPWTLTALTARAMGAWVTGMGLIAVTAFFENAWERVDVATAGYLALGVLQSVALLRYHSALDWSTVASCVYVGVVVSVLAVGIYGALHNLASLKAREATAPATP